MEIVTLGSMILGEISRALCFLKMSCLSDRLQGAQWSRGLDWLRIIYEKARIGLDYWARTTGRLAWDSGQRDGTSPLRNIWDRRSFVRTSPESFILAERASFESQKLMKSRESIACKQDIQD